MAAGGSSGFKRLGGFFSNLLGDRKSQKEETKRSDPEVVSFNKEVTSVEGQLRITPVPDGGVEFYSTLNPQRMLTIRAELAGPLSKFVKRGVESSVVVTAPLSLSNGEKHNAKITYYGPANSDSTTAQLVRCDESNNAEGQRLFEFVYSLNNEDCRYVIELDGSISVRDFQTVVDKRPLFQTVPPVAQMSAFLRAVTRRKRTVFDILEDLQVLGTPSTRMTIAALRDLVEDQNAYLCCDVAIRIKDLLSKQVSMVSEHVILAFALFIDMEVGDIRTSTLRAMDEIDASTVAYYSVINYFGGKVDTQRWSEIFGEESSSLSEVQEKLLAAPYADITSKFGIQISERTPTRVLEQIAKESHSMRALSFANALKDRLGANDIAISDQQLALLATLSVARRHYNPNVVAALCIFVDAEVGYISESDFESTNMEINGIDTSTYAMLAVAGAFDINLRGFGLDNLKEEEIAVALPALVRLTNVGFLGGFRKKDESKQSWHWVRTVQAAAKALQRNRNVEFTKTVLCALPVIEQLSEIDLIHLIESGRDFVAAFQSDYDKNIVWRRIKDIPEKSFRTPMQGKVRTSYSFIEGFSAYHFSRTVIGRIVEIPADKLIGCNSVIMVYHDNRDNRHYKYLEQVSGAADLEAPPNTGWVWKGEIVDNLDISGVPSVMHELTQNALLGKGVQFTREYRMLNWMFEALRKTILRNVDYSMVSSRAAFLQRIRAYMAKDSLRETVRNFVDDYTYKIMVELFGEDADFEVQMPSRFFEPEYDDEQLEMICLTLLHSIAASNELDEMLGGFYKQVDLAAFRVCLLEHIDALIASDDAAARIVGVKLLMFGELVPDASSRMTVEYCIARSLTDESNEVAYAACEAMIRLHFSHVVPMPLFTKLNKRTIAEEEEEEEEPDPIEIVGEVNIDRKLIREVHIELEDWIGDLKIHSPRRFRSLPFVGADGGIDSVSVQEFARFIAGLRQASINESGELPRRYYAMVPERQLDAICSVVVESWRMMVRNYNSTLCALLEESTPAELMLDHRFYVKEHDQKLFDSFGVRPYLGGASSPLTIYHLKPDELLAPYRNVSLAVSQTGQDESPMFRELVRYYFEKNDSRMIILRLHTADGIDLSELETFLPQFETTRSVDLRTAECFDPERMTYIPVFRKMVFTDEQIGSTPEEISDFQALMGILGGRKIAIKRESASGANPEEGAEGETDKALADSVVIEGEAEEENLETWMFDEEESALMNSQDAVNLEAYNKLASRLGHAFGMPKDLERQIVNMLLLVARHSSTSLIDGV